MPPAVRKLKSSLAYAGGAMRRYRGSWLLAVLVGFTFLISRASAQVDHITIAAGTDEDKALQAISNEQDNQKKLAMYEDFVQKFSANPQAVAFGNWQISQTYQANGDLNKALDYSDKALASSPHDLDIIVSSANIAQQAKNNASSWTTLQRAARSAVLWRSRLSPMA
jgi:tetratricopeptide (TPR) repeat protein